MLPGVSGSFRPDQPEPRGLDSAFIIMDDELSTPAGILIAADESLLADELAHFFAGVGAAVPGPAPDVAAARACLEQAASGHGMLSFR